MKIIVNTKEIKLFEKKIIDEMNRIDDNVIKMEALKNELVWDGTAYHKFIEKYDNNIKDIKDKMLSLTKCIKILDKFTNNFSEVQDEVKTKCKNIETRKGIKKEEWWNESRYR